MHYKNGREAKIGDRVIGVDYLGNPISGILVAQTATGDTCNIGIIPYVPNQMVTLTAKECMRVEDALSHGDVAGKPPTE